MLYEDNGEIESLLSSKGTPTVQVADEYKVQHQVWKVSDAGVIDLVRRKMRDKKLIIADGHHRYETALNYRNERRAAQPSVRCLANELRLAQLRTGGIGRPMTWSL